MNQPPVVALLTDFGLRDPYVGIMKGVILSKAPRAQLVDLTHEVPPQSVVEGAFLLQAAWRYFPPGTIFLVVVDPGVGSERRRLVVRAGGMTFIGPDNGCLSCVLGDMVRGERGSAEGYSAKTVSVGSGFTAVSIENTAIFGSTVSATFEGRDVFAPAAGFLASGGSIGDLGPVVEEMLSFPAFQAPKDKLTAQLHGLVLHIDTYGNLITDIRGIDVTDGARFSVRDVTAALVGTYSEAPPGTPVAIIGSSGYVEIAVASGRAAGLLQASTGDPVDALA